MVEVISAIGIEYYLCKFQNCKIGEWNRFKKNSEQVFNMPTTVSVVVELVSAG